MKPMGHCARWRLATPGKRFSEPRPRPGFRTGRDVHYPATLALAFAGDTVTAKTLADDWNKRFSEDTWVRQHAAPYELGDVAGGALYPNLCTRRSIPGCTPRRSSRHRVSENP